MTDCNHDCFHCDFPDCISDDVTDTEKYMQDYRDRVATVTGYIPSAHNKGNKGARQKRYTSGAPAKPKEKNYAKPIV